MAGCEIIIYAQHVQIEKAMQSSLAEFILASAHYHVVGVSHSYSPEH